MTNVKSVSHIPWLDKHVVVVGDIILDKYIEGYVDRVSPEAPVPVLNEKSERSRLGGAANVALNISRLGGKATLIGVIGDDVEAEKIKSMCTVHKINALLLKDKRPTTVKLRYVTEDGHQLLRVDREKTHHIDQSIQLKIFEHIHDIHHLPYDAMVLADYHKGVITDNVAQMILQNAWANGKPSIVDPKKKPFDIYNNVSVITPNKKEAAEALGLNHRSMDINDLGNALMDKFHLTCCLLTAGPDGMYLFEQNKPVYHIESDVKEVFDVSGAGDTVSAMMALGLGGKMDYINSATWASRAASIAVEHHGTYAPSLEELLNRG